MPPEEKPDDEVVMFVGECACEARKRDVEEGRLLPAAPLGGWVFVEAPLRHMSTRAKIAMHRREGAGFLDCSGEPFVFLDCVHCGGTLPKLSRREMDCWLDEDGA